MSLALNNWAQVVKTCRCSKPNKTLFFESKSFKVGDLDLIATKAHYLTGIRPDTKRPSTSRWEAAAAMWTVHTVCVPALVAQSDACLTGELEVWVWLPDPDSRWVQQHSFMETDHEIFSTVILNMTLMDWIGWKPQNKQKVSDVSSQFRKLRCMVKENFMDFNPSPAEPRHTLPLLTV